MRGDYDDLYDDEEGEDAYDEDEEDPYYQRFRGIEEDQYSAVYRETALKIAEQENSKNLELMTDNLKENKKPFILVFDSLSDCVDQKNAQVLRSYIC